MSEYQYYEFRAIEKPLTKQQLAEVRSLSTRAEITSTSFVNEYHFGDFKGEPLELLEKYYDAFVYHANWGTHRFSFRVPAKLVDLRAIEPYLVENVCSVALRSGWAIFEFRSECEAGGDWEEPDWMEELLPVRAAVLGGDLRPFYLGWLSAVESHELDDDAAEPPVPPGMQNLEASLLMLADFLRIEDSLVDSAGRRSPPGAPSAAAGAGLEKWVRSLPAKEKERLLLAGLAEPSPLWAANCLAEYRASVPKSPPPPEPAGHRLRVADLREVADAARREREEKEEEHRREQAERRAAEEAKKLEERRRKRAATLAAKKLAKK